MDSVQGFQRRRTDPSRRYGDRYVQFDRPNTCQDLRNSRNIAARALDDPACLDEPDPTGRDLVELADEPPDGIGFRLVDRELD